MSLKSFSTISNYVLLISPCSCKKDTVVLSAMYLIVCSEFDRLHFSVENLMLIALPYLKGWKRKSNFRSDTENECLQKSENCSSTEVLWSVIK